MRVLSFNLAGIELKILLISLLCHFLLAQLFIITLRPLPDEFKPAFVFLGSLLAANDFRNLNASRTSLPDEAVSTIPIRTSSNPFESARVLPKPAFSNAWAQKQKTFLKSSFIATPEESTKGNKIQNLGIDLTVPKRTPLKLDLK